MLTMQGPATDATNSVRYPSLFGTQLSSYPQQQPSYYPYVPPSAPEVLNQPQHASFYPHPNNNNISQQPQPGFYPSAPYPPQNNANFYPPPTQPIYPYQQPAYQQPQTQIPPAFFPPQIPQNTCTVPVTSNNDNCCIGEKTGYLLKRGARNTDFKSRYFVLRDGVLSYYINPKDKTPRGMIDIKGLKVHVDLPTEFKIYTSKRTYFLKTLGVHERIEWVNAVVKQGAVEKLEHINCT